MFCRNCGKEISDSAVVCPFCGTQVAELRAPENKPYCTMAVVGFVLSFFVSIAGLICSIIARKKCKEENLAGDGLALAGIIISAVSIGLTVISVFIIVSYFTAVLGFISSL